MDWLAPIAPLWRAGLNDPNFLNACRLQSGDGIRLTPTDDLWDVCLQLSMTSCSFAFRNSSTFLV
jgi:hypothetical protein